MTKGYTQDDRDFLEVQHRKQVTPDSIDKSKEQADSGPESTLLSKCTEYLDKHHYKYFHDYSKKKNKAGILDLYIFLPKKRLVVIELKSEDGRTSKEQKDWISYLLYHGYEVYKNVRSYKRFLEILYGRN